MSPLADGGSIKALTRDLCAFATGVVAEDNERLFSRIAQELPIRIHRYPSGSSFNGWSVPQLWKVRSATVSRDGKTVFDGTQHPLAVATYSKSFAGELELEELRRHVATNAVQPDAYVYHCMWQYRPWDADWALSIPHRVFKTFTPGRYRIDLQTIYERGEMLVADYEHRGASDRTIVFNAHTCHPGQANDDMAGVVVLIRLFQWLRERDTYYSYRLVLGPEHLGTVFYLHEREHVDLHRLVSGAFAEMPGTLGPVKVTSTFLGEQPIDRAFRHAARHYARQHRLVPWRKGAGNDETVWEAPGYEIPFVEVSRCLEQMAPYPEYHTSLDTADLLQDAELAEFLDVFRRVVEILEADARIHRRFNGLVCLSNPEYNLYLERPDPAVVKNLAADSEQWGYLLDCLLRYFDGSMTILEIADKHDLPFDRVLQYLERFRAKDLIQFDPARIERVAISAAGTP